MKPCRCDWSAGKGIAVAQIGSRMHYAVPRILAEAGVLQRLYTDLYLGDKPRVARVLSALLSGRRIDRLVERALSRSAAGLSLVPAVSYDLAGLGYSLALAWNHADARKIDRTQLTMGRLFATFVASRVARQPPTAVYAFSGAARELLETCRSHGILGIVEQVMAPRRVADEIVAAERERWPVWQAMSRRNQSFTLAWEREALEWDAASSIVCGSEFVRASLIQCGVDRGRVDVVPYGVDLQRFRPSMTEGRPTTARDRELRVLFVGEVGPRKGIVYLLDALRSLNSRAIETRVVGPMTVRSDQLKVRSARLSCFGSVPKEEVLRSYAWADVLVLPSLCEGSATVTYEALACGLPVVATKQAGSVVRDGVDGFVVPAGDSDAIAEAIQKYADTDCLSKHSEAARRDRERVGLRRYGRDLLAVLARRHALEVV